MSANVRTREELLAEFDERGFLIFDEALSPGQISALNHAIDCHLEKYPEEWVKFDESLMETITALSFMSDFDFTIENPITLGLLRRLIGEEITFEEFEIIIRNPTAKARDIKGWHRDLIRDYNRRLEINYISLIYYLTDVSTNDHCFSIVPGTHNRLVDVRPEEVVPGMEFDVIRPAGTAIIFHGRCIHAGKLKPNSRQRRTLHVYYDRSDRPRTTEWTEIPPRLYQKVDPALPPRLYSKWNVTEFIDGVGKKPRDLDPSMSTADMLREVQRRANRTA
jgi:phytanoyl-CoA dioxygenase PhyH